MKRGLPPASPPLSPSAVFRPEDAPADRVASLLNRPQAERLREYRYRFAQSIVFGIPVVALQLFGRGLGGAEAGRWVAGLQALLAGWVLYVGAAGLFFEGVIELSRGRLTSDFLAALGSACLYVASSVLAVRRIAIGADVGSLYFAWSVVLLAVWTGWRAWALRRHTVV